MILFTKAFVLILLFIINFSSFAHPPYLYPPAPSYQVCPYNQSSVCYTYTGRVCSMFVPNYQNFWFSACINQAVLHACLNLPTIPSQWVQNTCYPRGMPCTCAFGSYNGYYIYEPGQVL